MDGSRCACGGEDAQWGYDSNLCRVCWRAEIDAKKRLEVEKARLRLYRISRADLEMLSEAQGGLCAICEMPETGRSTRRKERAGLSIDHCHDTGQVRGLLCRLCNTGLGHFSDNPDLLRAAALYLERASEPLLNAGGGKG